MRARSSVRSVRCRITAQAFASNSRRSAGAATVADRRRHPGAGGDRRRVGSRLSWVCFPIAGVRASCAARRMTGHGVEPARQRRRIPRRRWRGGYRSGKTATPITRILALAVARQSLPAHQLDASRFAGLMPVCSTGSTLILFRGLRARSWRTDSTTAKVRMYPRVHPTWASLSRRSVDSLFHGVPTIVVGDVGVAGL